MRRNDTSVAAISPTEFEAVCICRRQAVAVVFLFGGVIRGENGWMLAEVSRLQFEFNLGSTSYATGQRHHVRVGPRHAICRLGRWRACPQSSYVTQCALYSAVY